MAAVTYSTVASALATIFENDVTWSINRAAVLFNLLSKRTGPGKNVTWDVRATDSLSAVGETAYTDGADISTYPDDALSAAALDYVTCQRAFRLSAQVIDAADVVNNPTAISDLWREKMMVTATGVIKDVNRQLYTGNPAASPPQVNSLLDATSGALLNAGSYAGLSRSSLTSWQSINQAAGGVPRPLTFQLLYGFISAIYDACGENPTVLVSNKQMWDAGAQLHTNLLKIEKFATPGGVTAFDAGCQALSFQGIPWFYDSDCPAGKIVALNLNHVQLLFMSMKGRGHVDTSFASYNPYPEAQLGMSSAINFGVKQLANAGLYSTFSLYFRPQLVVKRPNSCGVLADIAS